MPDLRNVYRDARRIYGRHEGEHHWHSGYDIGAVIEFSRLPFPVQRAIRAEMTPHTFRILGPRYRPEVRSGVLRSKAEYHAYIRRMVERGCTPEKARAMAELPF